MPQEHSPTVRYYRAMTGSWSGPYRFVITDPAAMRAAVPAWWDRRGLLLMHALGGARMSTTVAFRADDEVLHTTRVTAWGLPALSGVEVFRLADDGRSLSVRMVQRFAPLFRPPRDFGEGSGVVADPEVGADYRLPWLGGCVIEQRVRVVAGGVALAQTSAWFRAEARLVRHGRG